VKHWIVEVNDGAIGGFVRGSRSEYTHDGPFEEYEDALAKKPRGYGCTYYKIVESSTKPKDIDDEYEFVDADREFDDV